MLNHSRTGTPPSILTLPNLFMLGAPKAGTTSLFYDLDQHPDVYMSPFKEPNYFAEEIRVGDIDAPWRHWGEARCACRWS